MTLNIIVQQASKLSSVLSRSEMGPCLRARDESWELKKGIGEWVLQGLAPGPQVRPCPPRLGHNAISQHFPSCSLGNECSHLF